MTIADRIKKIREIFGITSNEFAKITGIHPVTIRKYETNKMVPGNDVIDKMSETLRLPKYIFEGFPNQYTDYSFEGDFYQQLFLLLNNNTLRIEGAFNEENFNEKGDNNPYDTWFSINPKLADYISIKHDGKDIPLKDISITLDPLLEKHRRLIHLWLYLDFNARSKEALTHKYWRSKSETKEEYSARLAELAQNEQLKLMLTERSWKQYMSGPTTHEDVQAAFNRVIESGGNYYDFVEQMDIPEANKQDYITEYENAWIQRNAIDIGEYPYNGTYEEKSNFAQKEVDAIQKYKEDHPNYKSEIKAACIKEQKERNEKFLKEKKGNSSAKKKAGAQN